jgi:hypothetical protein
MAFAWLIDCLLTAKAHDDHAQSAAAAAAV